MESAAPAMEDSYPQDSQLKLIYLNELNHIQLLRGKLRIEICLMIGINILGLSFQTAVRSVYNPS